jgi:hypothetical protein
LSNQTLVSVTVRGDITGEVKAGCLYRIDALRTLTAPFVGGTISGDLRATRGDEGATFGWSANCIGYVRAGWSITGDIIAEPERDGTGAPLFTAGDMSTWSSAGKIIVGPSLLAPGIQGDINCEYGQIGEIISTGQIGTSESQRSSITAGVRINRITLRNEAATGDAAVLEKPIYADVDASARDVPANPVSAVSVSLIETKGDFVGRIEMHDFYGPGDPFGAGRDTTRKGIFIGGDLIGDIDVKYSFEFGDIVARSIRGDAALGFTGKVRIGQLLQGGIIAVGTEGSTDPLDGTIASVEIGYSPDLSGAPRANLPGFSGFKFGLADPPYEGVHRENWYSMPYGDWYSAASVIRASKALGDVRIKSMSNRLSTYTYLRYFRPLVEAPVIQDLWIDHLDFGAVWSGHLNSQSQTITNTITDDYASIGQLHIGCVGPAADLWVKDTPRIDIAGDMFGEIHLKELTPDQVVRIGGRLGDRVQAQSPIALCQAEGAAQGEVFRPLPYISEASPRNYWEGVESTWTYYFGVADYGRIVVRTPQRLRGQIILDANHATDFTRDPTTHWRGDVLVGTGKATDLNQPNDALVGDPNTLRIISTSTGAGRATAGCLAPIYPLKSDAFGGLISCMGATFEQTMQSGAVGLASFGFYGTDARFIDITSPADCSLFPFYPTEIWNAEFSQYTVNDSGQPTGVHRVGVRLPFYGPVFSTLPGSANPLKVEWHADALPGGPEVTCDTETGCVDVSSRCGTSMDRAIDGTLSRHMTLWGLRVLTKDRVLPGGHYRVSIANPATVRSDGMLPEGVAPLVPQFKYCFYLQRMTGLDEPGNGVCIADMDDGTMTGTPNGGVGIEDLIYFLVNFEVGSILVDIDGPDGGGQADGGTDVNDLLFFLARFEAGC